VTKDIFNVTFEGCSEQSSIENFSEPRNERWRYCGYQPF